MVIEKIRAATKVAHEELDSMMMPIIANIHSAEDYCKLLLAFYGYYKPVYDKIDMHLDASLLSDYDTRRKPEIILQNLNALSYHSSSYAISHCLPEILNNPEAFGALYVMEGSTMGGLMIKKMIADKLNLPDETLSFFAAYGKQTRERWSHFIATLNEIAITPEEENELVASAIQTFSCFKQWLSAVYFA